MESLGLKVVGMEPAKSGPGHVAYTMKIDTSELDAKIERVKSATLELAWALHDLPSDVQPVIRSAMRGLLE